mmetsp:Transcript_4507/g.11835  ORF Transcript_4507/g.11835 Transcript_4507/m.11835 type:complete len:358 (+) Transcript_4507:1140-2213(+)
MAGGALDQEPRDGRRAARRHRACARRRDARGCVRSRHRALAAGAGRTRARQHRDERRERGARRRGGRRGGAHVAAALFQRGVARRVARCPRQPHLQRRRALAATRGGRRTAAGAGDAIRLGAAVQAGGVDRRVPRGGPQPRRLPRRRRWPLAARRLCLQRQRRLPGGGGVGARKPLVVLDTRAADGGGGRAAAAPPPHLLLFRQRAHAGGVGRRQPRRQRGDQGAPRGARRGGHPTRDVGAGGDHFGGAVARADHARHRQPCRHLSQPPPHARPPGRVAAAHRACKVGAGLGAGGGGACVRQPFLRGGRGARDRAGGRHPADHDDAAVAQGAGAAGGHLGGRQPLGAPRERVRPHHP